MADGGFTTGTVAVPGYAADAAFGVTMRTAALGDGAAAMVGSISQSLNDLALVFNIRRDLRRLRPEIDQRMPPRPPPRPPSTSKGTSMSAANNSGVCVISIYDDFPTEIGAMKEYQSTFILGPDLSLDFAADRYRRVLEGPGISVPVKSGWSRHYIFWWFTP